MLKNIIATTAFLLSQIFTFAQNSDEAIEMADIMYSSGKIYVVVGVLVTIFTGIVLFLIHLERKISKIENKLNP